MQSSDFFRSPDIYSYPAEFNVLRDWVIQYYRFKHISPESMEGLKNRPEEFELIPVPKSLGARLGETAVYKIGGGFGIDDFLGTASEGAPVFRDPFSMMSTPTPSSTTLAKSAESLAKLRKYPELVKTFRTFCVAIEAGDDKVIADLIADDYADAQGRDREALLKQTKKLIDKTSKRRIVPVHADELEVVGQNFAAKITGAWESEVDGVNDMLSEYFHLEVVFSPDQTGIFKITAIRHVE